MERQSHPDFERLFKAPCSGERNRGDAGIFRAGQGKVRSYSEVLLEPVQVWRREKSVAKNIDQEDANYSSQYLYLRADEELRKDYAMIQQLGPGVIRIRTGITGAG